MRPRTNTNLRSTVPRGDGVLPEGLASLLAWLCAAALVTGAGVGLVWVKAAQVQARYDIHRLQGEVRELRQAQSALEVEVQSLLRPERLAKVGRDTFGLVPPKPSQLIDLRDHSGGFQGGATP